ncbi:ribbon-helix-helix protein, CopG family [Agrococcus sp. KRD186]|uniref:ribbon-helix-helix protein, CopG family n=1 Tax=Agrococcus sp. KRD186 TaxID=2729730 RepID=UPI001F49A7A0|nr:ribbon-helix-helix protein, CopG family [Agrococcus sp. KRD186]
MKRTMQGHEVDEPKVDEWVAEAEAGYDVDTLRTRWGRAPRGSSAAQVVPVRLTEAELAAVMARAERDGLNRSEAIRAALDAWAHAA